MKKIVLVSLAVLSALFVNAQIAKLKDVQSVKEGKIIVALTENEEVNTWIKDAVKTYWTFCEVIEYTDLKSARDKAKADKNLFVLSFRDAFVPSPSHTTYVGETSKQNTIGTTSNITTITKHYVRYRNVTSGQFIEVNGVREFIPSFEDGECPQAVIVFAIRNLQHTLKTMDENNLASNMKLFDAYKKDTPLLKEETLYLPEEWITKGFDTLKLAELYAAKIKVVSYEDWSYAIINNQEGIAYCMIVPRPTGTDYTYMHYIVDAKTSKVLAVVYPKVAVSIANKNVSKSNTGYINEKNIKMYNDALNGKW